MCVQRRRRPTLVVLRLLTDCYGRRSSDIPKHYTGVRDTTFARVYSERNNLITKRVGYIHTYKIFPRFDAELVASR